MTTMLLDYLYGRTWPGIAFRCHPHRNWCVICELSRPRQYILYNSMAACQRLQHLLQVGDTRAIWATDTSPPPITPPSPDVHTHLRIGRFGACKCWYRGCTVLCAFLLEMFMGRTGTDDGCKRVRGRVKEMHLIWYNKHLEGNWQRACLICPHEHDTRHILYIRTYIGYHWNVATLRDNCFHIAGTLRPEYGRNAIAYHLGDGLRCQHRITLGIIPAQR